MENVCNINYSWRTDEDYGYEKKNVNPFNWGRSAQIAFTSTFFLHHRFHKIFSSLRFSFLNFFFSYNYLFIDLFKTYVAFFFFPILSTYNNAHLSVTNGTFTFIVLIENGFIIVIYFLHYISYLLFSTFLSHYITVVQIVYNPNFI